MKNLGLLVLVLVVLGLLGWYLPKLPVKLPQFEPNKNTPEKTTKPETDLWQVYEDQSVGFSFKYPPTVVLENGEKGNLALTVESILIDELDYPGFDKTEVLNDVQLLISGQPGTNYSDWALDLSEKIRNLGKINAQEFMVLSRFEVCSVVFERKLLFYHNNYRVIITLKETKSNIVDNLPQYFETNEENCGTNVIWNFDKQEQFYRDLVVGKSFFTAQEWFDTFDKIINTIEINTVETYENEGL